MRDIVLKNSDQIEKLRAANLIVWEVHQELAEMLRPGVSTAELDERARKLCESAKAKPAFLGYPAHKPGIADFPGVLCTSVNEEIVHGIPGDRVLKEGDIISIDFGCQKDGFFGDAAVTHPIGKVTPEAERLLQVTEESLACAIEQCVVGKRLGDISHAVQTRVEAAGFGIVREFVGHGIGEAMHEPPHVPNFGKSGRGRRLKAGMVLAIEPMVTAGDFSVKLRSDGWTAVTADASLSAHFEHSVAICDKGPYILSKP